MNEQLFRKKNIDRVTSPEQLNEYIRVSNPGIWMVLSAIVILLVGVCVWGVVGHLDTTLSVVALAENGDVTLYVKEEDAASVKTGMPVQIADGEFAVLSVASEPVAVGQNFSEYARHVGNLQLGEWVYAVSADGQLADGVYSGVIVIEREAPMSFVLN